MMTSDDDDDDDNQHSRVQILDGVVLEGAIGMDAIDGHSHVLENILVAESGTAKGWRERH